MSGIGRMSRPATCSASLMRLPFWWRGGAQPMCRATTTLGERWSPRRQVGGSAVAGFEDRPASGGEVVLLALVAQLVVAEHHDRVRPVARPDDMAVAVYVMRRDQ